MKLKNLLQPKTLYSNSFFQQSTASVLQYPQSRFRFRSETLLNAFKSKYFGFSEHNKQNFHQDSTYFDWRWAMFSSFGILLFSSMIDHQNQVRNSSHEKQKISNRVGAIQYSSNNPIEDRFKLAQLTNIDGYLVAVYDGHGGYDTSEYAKNHLDEAIDNAFKVIPKSNFPGDEDKWVCECIRAGFAKVENELLEIARIKFHKEKNPSSIRVGSCCLVSLIIGNKVYTANLGDCRGVVLNGENSSKFTKLNKKQNANSKREQKELVQKFPNEKNIFVCRKNNPNACYVKGSLQPTRALGDFRLKYAEFNNPETAKQLKIRCFENFKGPYILSDPDITITTLNKDSSHLILATDGLWDELTFKDVAEEISRLGQNATNLRVTANLLQNALNHAANHNSMTRQKMEWIPTGNKRRDIHDDITIVCVDLRNQI